ncbi:TetR/AcrR family transcriptional regulator [Streptomyces sp. BE303]|uniref:TetR/AcrR family transcriptional regulator n=1 Tax=Streptomyces sp. BE303 TaxID=3002528 RepID=UPI002E78BA77|nr:TetR/AcrR family transcriptional regulator [Streptomyces sp. BE303]MED7953467.1 TetR/AcrR family transcriptional regulator [Streptomyces sp. BE303]
MAYRRTPAVQARLDAQREAVLQAAVGLLAERGYGGCTMAAVADRAGIATGSMYQHFASKAELSVELFRRVVTREVAAVHEAVARHDTPRTRIAAVVETFAARALRAPRLAHALLVEPADTVVDAERLVFRRAFRDVIAAEITAALATGDVPGQDPELTAAAIVGAVGEALAGPLAAARPPDTRTAPPEVVPALVSFTLRALGGRDDSDA